MAGRALKQLVAAWRRVARSSAMLRGAAGCDRRRRSREAHTCLANPDYLPNDSSHAALLERQRCRPVVRQKCGMSFRPREAGANGRRARCWLETGPGGARHLPSPISGPWLATDQAAHGTLARGPRQREPRARPTGRTAMHTLARSCTPSCTCGPKTWAGGPSGPAASRRREPNRAPLSHGGSLPCRPICPGSFHKVDGPPRVGSRLTRGSP